LTADDRASNDQQPHDDLPTPGARGGARTRAGKDASNANGPPCHGGRFADAYVLSTRRRCEVAADFRAAAREYHLMEGRPFKIELKRAAIAAM